MPPDSIEAIYPLSPMQQGLLFHALRKPGVGLYVTQLSLELRGHVDVAALKRAWATVIARHPVLRTAFVAEGLDRLLQVVLRKVGVPITVLDWRSSDGGDGNAGDDRLRAHLDEDRRRDFDLLRAPLMRLTVIRRADDRHQVIWTFHHAILDGWSKELVIDEAIAYYRAFQSGTTLDLPAPRPYADYLAWLSDQNVERAEEFWRRALDGFTTPTPLPGQDEASTTQDDHTTHAARELQLGSELTTRVSRFASDAHVTLNTVVQGAWALVLSRCAGVDDVVFGATVSGRPATLPGVNAMAGVFINTPPVRVKLPRGERISAWLQALQRAQVEARQYEYASLIDIHRWSQVPRGTPLFHTIVVFANFPTTAFRESYGTAMDGASASASPIEVGDADAADLANYPLALSVFPGPNLSVRVAYDSTIVDDAVVERLCGQLRRVFEQLVDGPSRPLSSVRLLDAVERRQVVETWNAMARDYGVAEPVHALVDAQVQQRPDAAAVSGDAATVTYAALTARANQLAQVLCSRGVGAEVCVGVCLERGVDLMVALLAVLKAGGAYVPLDPTYPSDRLAYMLADAAVPVVVTSGAAADRLPATWAQVVRLDRERDAAEITTAPRSAPASAADVVPEQLAYVIYTSGSTGQPKGVGLTHAGAWNLARVQAEQLQIAATAAVLQFASPSFDAATWEWLMTLPAGARLVVRPREELLPGGPLEAVIQREGVDTITLPPSTLAALGEERGALRTIVVAGEACSAAIVERWARGRRLIDAYGPSETTVCATMSGPLEADGRVHIGGPIGNAQVYVLDREGEPVPVGVAGELFIGGACMGRGYLGRSSLTASRFVPDPFGRTSGARLYRTGDRVRWRADGTLDFLGRLDFQVKLRGYRIELGEVEAALLAQPGVQQAVAIVRDDAGSGAAQLVAYVAGGGAGAADGRALREALRTRLPDYLVPSVVVTLDALPLTTSGKVDRRALPAPVVISAQSASPRNAVEETLAGIWARVLGRPTVGIHDNFFELGGDSILSIQVVSRAAQAGIGVTIPQVFQHQTIAALAVVATATSAAGPAIVMGETGPVPLTPIQAWWFAQTDRPRSNQNHYNQAVLVRVHRYAQIAALSEAMTAVLAHHDALRLRFTQHAEGWMQTVPAGTAPPALTRVDLGSLAAPVAALERLAATLQRSLDVQAGPIVRAVYADMGTDDDGRLLLIAHHLIVDGVSWRILFDDVQHAYAQRLRGAAVQLALATPFRQWARAVACIDAAALHADAAYWRDQSWDERARLPRDATRHAASDVARMSPTATVAVACTVEQTRVLLQDVPARWQVPLHAAIVAAVAASVVEASERDAVSLALEGHGREDVGTGVDVSRTVGWFTSLYPVLVRWPATGSLRARVQDVRDQLARVPRRGIGFGLLRWGTGTTTAAASAREALAAIPEPEILVNYLGQLDRVLEPDALFAPAAESAGPEQPNTTSPHHPLDISARIVDAHLQVDWRYSTRELGRDTVERLADAFRATLEQVVLACASPEPTRPDVSGVDLTDQDLDEIWAELSDTRQ